MYKIINIIMLLSLLNPLFAGDEDDFKDFTSLLDTASVIATKKSLNVDYLPSVVTVIDAQTFLDGGIETIAEALDMLPGIQMQLNYIGEPITNIRGFKNPNSTLTDKVKILIDGVAIENEATGTSGFYLDFPMQLVEKIELLRGPGSTIYGAGAFYGTINIITKLGNSKEENQIYTGLGSYDYGTVGGNLQTEVGNYKIFTDGFYTQNNKYIKDYAQTTDERMKNLSLGFKVKNGNFEFLTRYKASHYGNFFIPKGNFQVNKDDGHKKGYFFAQLSYKTKINDFKIQTKLNYSHRVSKLNAYFSTDTREIADAFKVVDLVINDAYYIQEKQVEQNIGAEVIVNFPKITANEITLVAGARQTSMPTNSLYSNLENSIASNLTAILNNPNYDKFRFNAKREPAYWKDPTSTKIFSTTQRKILYLSLQDLVSLSDDLDFVIGLRFDDYSDIGHKLSSRAGLVYRANDKLILKLLYGSAFRAPSFTEAYSKGHIDYRAGDASIQPEVTNTYETAIIYKPDLKNKLSLNIYYSKLRDVIDLEELEGTVAGYQNMKDRVSKGVEFEYYFKTQQEHNFYINASYIESDYTIPKDSSTPEVDQSMPDISKSMIKVMYIYKPTTKLSFGSIWRYYSQTTKTALAWIVNNKSKVPTVSEQHILDETVTYRFSSTAKIRLTLKNIFNEEVRTPSYYYSTRGGNLREGRNYYLKYIQAF